MSSLRNAVKRITHKERAQPQARANLGILEKKKDYKVRAIDYHRKENRIKAMRQAAAMRNPDEFYFGMHKAQVHEDGKHRKTREAERKEFEEQVGHETVRIMKDQDLGYIRMKKQQDAKKMEKLRESHQLIGAPTKRKHVVFVESVNEVETFDAAEHFETIPEFVPRAHNRLRKDDIQRMATADNIGDQLSKEDMAVQLREQRKLAKKLARAKDVAYREITGRQKRIASLSRAEAHLVTEKLVASKGRKRKIKAAENGQPAQYKWRRQRLG